MSSAVPAGTPIYTDDGEFLGQVTLAVPPDYGGRLNLEFAVRGSVTATVRSGLVALELGVLRFNSRHRAAWFLRSGGKDDVRLCRGVAPAWRQELDK